MQHNCAVGFRILAIRNGLLRISSTVIQLCSFIFNPPHFFVPDFGGGIVRFSSNEKFLGLKDDERLLSIVSSTSCLATVAENDSNEKVSQLIDFISGLNVKEKHLLIQMSSGLESNVLKKKRINFNVVITHSSSGACDCGLFSSQAWVILVYFKEATEVTLHFSVLSWDTLMLRYIGLSVCLSYNTQVEKQCQYHLSAYHPTSNTIHWVAVNFWSHKYLLKNLDFCQILYQSKPLM